MNEEKIRSMMRVIDGIIEGQKLLTTIVEKLVADVEFLKKQVNEQHKLS